MRLASSTNDKRPRMTATRDIQTPPQFLILSGSYSTLSLALCNGDTITAAHTAHDVRASAQLLPLLNKHLFIPTQSTIHDVAFIAVNAGPGAFTSLRVLLATVNGMALAAKKPVVSCDGIAVTAQCLAAKTPAQQEGIVLFNAYNNEVYYCMVRSGKIGYQPLEQMVTQLKNYAAPVTLAGQGVAVYEEQLRAAGVDLSCWDQSLAQPPLEALARDALLQWEKTTTKRYEARPLHLKEQRFKKLTRS